MEAIPYKIPLRIPYVWAKGVQYERRGLWIRYGTAWGEVAPPPHAVPSDAVLLEEFRRVTTGLSPRSSDFLDAVDRRKPNCRIRCGISTAWHAFNGTIWGDRADRVPVNGLITGDEIEAQVEHWLSLGVSCLKVKIDGRNDYKRVQRVRRSAGKEVSIRLDANESLTGDVLSHLKRLAEFDIEYIEQPLAAADVEGLSMLQRECGIDIAIDEAATTPERIGELLQRKAGKVVILKPQRLGGPDRIMEAIDVAQSFGSKVVITNSLETAIGVRAALDLAACLPRPIPPCGLATSYYLAEDKGVPPAVVKGAIQLSGFPVTA